MSESAGFVTIKDLAGATLATEDDDLIIQQGEETKRINLKTLGDLLVFLDKIEQVKTSTENGGINEIKATLSDGSTATFTTQNGHGIQKIEQTVKSDVSSGTNVITATLSDGQTCDFEIKNGDQGEKGDTGAALIDVVQKETSAVSGGKNVISFKLDDGSYKDVEVYNGAKGETGEVSQEVLNQTVNEAIAGVVANAPEDFDTLKEMSDWISEHEDDAAAMNTAILENKKDSLESKINRILTDYSLDLHGNALRLCFVSPTETSVRYGTTTFTCYKSISTAIDTEYPLMNINQLGLLCVVLEGKYIENIRLYEKENVAIIGIDKRKCVIENKATEEHHGYHYPPLWINPSTTIGGLTINCVKKTGLDTEKDAYCIHTDDDGVGRVLIKNCNMYCEQHACIGFGTREHAPLFIEDCSMLSLGKCLYGHNSCGQQITGAVHEELHIYNCYGRSGSNVCIDIFDANNFYPPAGSRPKNLDWLVYMNNNVFLNNNSLDSYPTTLHISPYYEEATDKVNYFSKNIRRMPSNKGNNSPFFNYISNDVDKTEVVFTDICLKATDGGSGCYYVVRNGVCYVTLDVTTINTFGFERIGLPTPLFSQQFSIQPYNTQDKNGFVKLYVSGDLEFFCLINNTRYIITFSYLVA